MNNTDMPRAALPSGPGARPALPQAELSFSQLVDLEERTDLHGRGLAQVASAAARLRHWVGGLVGSVQSWWRVRTVRVGLEGLSRRLARMEPDEGPPGTPTAPATAQPTTRTAQRALAAYARVLRDVEKIPRAERGDPAVMGQLSQLRARIVELQRSALAPFDGAALASLEVQYRSLRPLMFALSGEGAESDPFSASVAD